MVCAKAKISPFQILNKVKEQIPWAARKERHLGNGPGNSGLKKNREKKAGVWMIGLLRGPSRFCHRNKSAIQIDPGQYATLSPAGLASDQNRACMYEEPMRISRTLDPSNINMLTA
jgi:hypothetical protein